MNAQQRGCRLDEQGQRRRRSHGMFIALALAAVLSSALVPLLHRNHTHGGLRDLIASVHPAHGEGCSILAPSAADRGAPVPASPERDDDSSCPICVFLKSGQSRGLILPPAGPMIAPPRAVERLSAPADLAPRASERPHQAAPRAPPRSIA